MPEVEQLLGGPRVVRVKLDLCWLAVVTFESNHEVRAARKIIGFMTGSKWIARELDGVCDSDHHHEPIVGGRSSPCARYPAAPCGAFCRGVANQKNKDQSVWMKPRPTSKNTLYSLARCNFRVSPIRESSGTWADVIHEEY